MDIDLLAKMVKKLILDGDRVVLPGLGCFVAELVPATFSDRGYTINPPYRKLYFRSKPDEGDELVLFYAESNNLPFEVAEEVMKDFLSEMKTVLFMKKTVVFPGLGRLRATKENDIFFVADEDLDIYPSGFGLEPISLKSHNESKEEVKEVVSELKSMLEEPMAEPESQSRAVPVPEPVPEPMPESAPMQEVADATNVKADAVSEPEVVPEPIPLQMPDQDEECESSNDSESVSELSDEDDTIEDRKCSCRTWGWLIKPRQKRILMIVGGVLAAIALFFVLFVILANVFPSWMDAMLYSSEELEILNHRYE